MTQTNGTDGQTPYRHVMFSAMDTASVIVRGHEMPFGGQTRMDSRSHALDGGRTLVPPGKYAGSIRARH